MICPNCKKDELLGWCVDIFDGMEHETLSKIGWVGMIVMRCPCGYWGIEDITISNGLTDYLKWYIYIDREPPFIHLIRLKSFLESEIAKKYRNLAKININKGD